MLKASQILLPLILATSVQAASPTSTSQSPEKFRQIQQPTPVKIAVTTAGLGLIGLEIWWFMFSRPKAKKATTNQDIQELQILVDGGYEPNRITVNSGQQVRLKFHRKDPSHCLEKVLFPDFNISKDLPLDQTTTVEFTPEKPGEYTFSCGMNMVRGTLEVRG
ncbi:MAG: cupredoxin domain-containing protein [Cyanobacteriota bacterium]|nr:cupredoxin domain-containing protein [Cyanobacteriota bacterium]